MFELEAIKWVFIILPIVLMWIFFRRFSTKQKKSVAKFKEAVEAGLTEPASLHPIFNPNKCVGCGACFTACPEGEIIGLIRGKAKLVKASKCIGHGACKRACPFDAITLVFGTAKRGIDIPDVHENFETNLPGLFIAGELGGMGLIGNAIEQGRQAMENIRKADGVGKGKSDLLDVVIIGAGPSGFSATLGAKQHKLRAVTLEQDSLGGTVFNFPRGKIVMTRPVNIPLVGKVKLRETTKEALLEMWQAIEKKTGVKINYKEKMEDIEPIDGGYLVTTLKNKYKTRTVLLCIGRRGTPRKLGVPGEEQPKVVYQLIDPADFQNKHVLIVGGGDSALEAAHTIADEPGTTVSISYRSPSFSRAKQKNQEKTAAASESGKLNLLMSTTVNRITEDAVIINQDDKEVEIKNDGILVCAGGILPTPFLKKIGIMVETKHGNV